MLRKIPPQFQAGRNLVNQENVLAQLDTGFIRFLLVGAGGCRGVSKLASLTWIVGLHIAGHYHPILALEANTQEVSLE